MTRPTKSVRSLLNSSLKAFTVQHYHNDSDYDMTCKSSSSNECHVELKHRFYKCICLTGMPW